MGGEGGVKTGGREWKLNAEGEGGTGREGEEKYMGGGGGGGGGGSYFFIPESYCSILGSNPPPLPVSHCPF